MSDFDEAVAEIEGSPPIQKSVAPKKRSRSSNRGGPVNEKSIGTMLRNAPKVRIMLEDNDGIPPGGQFVAINGYAYTIMPGEEVDVPEPILKVLDDARVSRPIRDSNLRIIGYRRASRIPYRIIRDAKKSKRQEAKEE